MMNEKSIKIHTASSKSKIDKFKALKAEINKFIAKNVNLKKKKAKKVNLGRPFFGNAVDNLLDETIIEDSFKIGISTKFNLNENISIDESFVNILNAVTKLNDSSGISDEPNLNLDVKLLNTITAEELFKHLNSLGINLNDSVTLSEIFNLKETINFLDSTSIDDNLVDIVSFKNEFLSSVGLSELLTIIVNSDIQEQIADSVLIGDDFLHKLDILLNLSDSTSVLDSIFVKSEIPISLDDSMSVEDNLNFNTNFKLNLTDSVTLEDLISDVLNSKSIFTEVIIANDDFISKANFVNNISSLTNVSDDLNTANVFNEVIPVDVVVNTSEEEFDQSVLYYVYGIFADDELTSFLILGVRDTTLISPLNISVAGNTTFTWNTAENATGYDLQVATSSNFLTGIVVNITNLSTTSYTVQTILTNNNYFWRVRGRNNTTGKIGNWTPNGTFSVITLAPPQIVFPANNQLTDIPTTIIWNPVAQALSYDIQISTNSAFNTFFEINTNTTNTSFVFSAMLINTPYYFRLRSVSGSLVSAWTDTRAFFKIPSILNDSITSSDSLTSKASFINSLNDSASLTDSITSEVVSIITTDDIYLYQLLSDDPTTKTLINWVDEAGTPDGTTQTLTYYPEGNPSSITTLNVTGTVVPNTSNSAFRYSAKISGLTANTTYKCKVTKSGFISNEYTFKTFKTTLGSDSFRVAVLSDIHIDRTTGGSMNSAARMQHVRSQNPDVLFLMGDIVSQSYNLNTTNSQLYLTFFKEHINTYLNTSRVMIPMVNIPGNHDLGERNPATTNVSATSGYFQLFWNTFKEYNSNNNYGAIKFGNYLKLVGLDLFSANPTTNANFINGLANDTEYVIPFSHFPILPSTTRESYDADYFNPVIQGLAPALNSNNKIKAYFTGHMHTRFNSKGWKVVNTSPAPANSLSLGSNNYIVEDTSATRKKEYGQGYRNNRPLATVTTGGNTFGNTAWYVNEVESSENIGTFYVVEIKAANEKFDVITYNSTSSGVQSVRTDNLIGGEEFVQFSETITVSDNIEQEETITELEPLYLAIDDSIWDI